MLSFTIAHLSVVQMRRSLSDQERPYRGPGNVRLGNMDIPLFAVFGGAATFVSLCVVTVLHVTVAIAGLGWLAIGVVFYYFFRHHHGLELTRTVQIVEPSSPVEGEAEYESVLVAFPRTTFSEEAMALALRIGARRRRAIHVLVTIDVPAFLTADAILPDAEAAAQSVIEQAKVQGGRRVTGTVRRVRPRQHGPAIVDEAKRIKASAIVLSKSNKQSMGVFDQTEQHVLGARPCRVVIESEPPDVRRPSRALAPA
jgi:APA family basic amino acid/polyamine antiporter